MKNPHTSVVNGGRNLWLMAGVLMLAACSGGGSGDSASTDAEPWKDEPATQVESSGTLSGTIDGAALSGQLNAVQYHSGFGTFILYGSISSGDTFGVVNVSLEATLMGVGTFRCGDEGVKFTGNINNTGAEDSVDCTIEITRFGDVGEPVVGRYEGTLGGHMLDVSFEATRGSAI